MAYNYEYPYTDPSRTNVDWLLKEMASLDQKIAGLEETILAQSKEYVDQQIAVYADEVAQLRSDFDKFRAEIEQNQDSFQQIISAQLTVFDHRINDLHTEILAAVVSVNARTDQAIEQNNQYILEEVSKGFSGILVTNYFTGNQVSIQEMFDILSRFHAGGILYSDLAARNNTYDNMIAYNMTYTELVTNGNTIIVQK